MYTCTHNHLATACSANFHSNNIMYYISYMCVEAILT